MRNSKENERIVMHAQKNNSQRFVSGNNFIATTATVDENIIHPCDV